MSRETQIIVGQIRLLIHYIRKAGGSDSDLAAATGIDPAEAEDPDFPVSLENYVRLWQYAVEVTGDPALGLFLGTKHNREMLGLGKRVAQYSKDLREALNHWKTYTWMTSEIRREEESVVISHNVPFPVSCSVPAIEYEIAVAYCYACHISSCVIPLTEVHFRHPAPDYAGTYRDIFHSKAFLTRKKTL